MASVAPKYLQLWQRWSWRLVDSKVERIQKARRINIKHLLSAAFEAIQTQSPNDPKTVQTNSNLNYSEDAREIQQILIDKDEFLEVLGDTPGKKAEEEGLQSEVRKEHSQAQITGKNASTSWGRPIPRGSEEQAG